MDDATFLFDGPRQAAITIALAHGAGAAMDTPFMDAFAAGLAERGLCVARFEFPYMTKRRADGKRRPPDRAPVLLQTWRDVIAALGAEGLIIGGKSMGGRMASLVADESGVRGLVCLGYPFHPSGKPEKLRTDHLSDVKTPTLIVQGERDPLGNREEVGGYALSTAITLDWMPDGDHSFKPRKASGHSEPENWDRGIAAVADFSQALAG